MLTKNETNPKFDQLCEKIAAEKKRLKIPGVAVGIFADGQEWSAGLGKTSLENPLRVTPDTLFQVGSISKTFTGTVLMRLVEMGQLDLDTPVRKILPKFKMADPKVERTLTTRHLLTHTGGWLGDYFDSFGDGDDALQKMVKKIRKLPQITPLGEAFSYNNTGFNLAGRIIEVLTGLPYETAVQQMLLTPLGLEMTFFYPSDQLITHRFVCGHQKLGRQIQIARPWAIGRAGNPVGGVVSTVRDLLKYARFHMGDGANEKGESVMRPETLEAMRMAQADAGGRGQIGLTWFIRQAEGLTLYGHGGATHGQQAMFRFIPQKNFAAALLVNSDEGGILTDAFENLLLETFFDITPAAPAPQQKTQEELAEFAGRYELPLSCVELTPQKGCLLCRDIPRGGFPTPDSPPGPARPDARLAFYAADRLVGLDEPRKGALCEFIRGEDGTVRFLRIGGRIHPKVS